MIKKETLGCLFYCVVICSLPSLLFLIFQNVNVYYLVEETGYFHSTDNEKKCRFIKYANERGYSIKKIKKDVPQQKSYNICKECFSRDKQDNYNKEMIFSKKINQSIVEQMEWSYLTWDIYGIDSYDFNKLYVYIDSKNILHIDGICFNIDGKASRHPFSEIDSISSTCASCVGREYCDFIYKKIYEGVYDIKVIKEVDYEDD